MTHHTFAAFISAEPVALATTETQRPYDPPAVVYEAALEVRAGSPLGLSDPANPLNLP
jgi:hypothetical protein